MCRSRTRSRSSRWRRSAASSDGPGLRHRLSRRRPAGFANLVPRGRVGIVSASGTGLQQVAALPAEQGEGISHAIGVGGRDMSLAVGGLMSLAALDALGDDPATEVIAVIGKPGALECGAPWRRSCARSGSPPSSPSLEGTWRPVTSGGSRRWRPSRTRAGR